MRAWTITSVLAAAAVLSAPGSAAAQSADSPADAVRLTPYLLVGAGGEAELSSGGFSISNDLDATVGLGARVAVPLVKYLLVGGLFEWGSFKADNSNDRDHLLDVDAFIGGRYVLDVEGMPLELHALFTIGELEDAAKV